MSVTWLPENVNPVDGFKNAFQPDTVLLLRGAGHNLMQYIPEGTPEADLTPLQTVERDATAFAESMGLKLVTSQTNIEGKHSFVSSKPLMSGSGYLINHLHAAR